ncbi:hypothetical protein OOU_Y34scaffold00670g2, partial [Pyricularia oryzae Y34]
YRRAWSCRIHAPLISSVLVQLLYLFTRPLRISDPKKSEKVTLPSLEEVGKR